MSYENNVNCFLRIAARIIVIWFSSLNFTFLKSFFSEAALYLYQHHVVIALCLFLFFQCMFQGFSCWFYLQNLGLLHHLPHNHHWKGFRKKQTKKKQILFTQKRNKERQESLVLLFFIQKHSYSKSKFICHGTVFHK